MVKQCCVDKCRSEAFAGCGISFHGIPTNEERRELWIRAMRLKPNVSKHANVCSLHFNLEDYIAPYSSKLKPDAVPSVIKPMDIADNEHVILNSNQLQVVSDSEDNMNATDTSHEEPDCDQSRLNGDDFEISEEPPDKKVKLTDTATQTVKIKSPEKEKLQRDIKALRQKIRRYETKILNLNTILKVVLKKKKMKIMRS